jgi:hypothetical protein
VSRADWLGGLALLVAVAAWLRLRAIAAGVSMIAGRLERRRAGELPPRLRVVR